MKKALLVLTIMACTPLAAFGQDSTQTQFNVPPEITQDPANYQDPSSSAATVQGGPLVPGVATSLPGVSVNGLPVAVPAGPATAREQGYDPEMALFEERMRREAADHAAMNTARQLGQVITAPRVLNPVGSDPSSQAWIQDWVTVLSGVGIPASKVAFEANRLTKDDFEMWASRMVWAYGTPAGVHHKGCCGQ